MGWGIDRHASGDGERNELAEYPNIQISLSLSARARQISMTKWTYNWKPGGPEILLTFFLTRLDISSGELRG